LRQTAPTEGYSDLYFDTINRSILDFDFEKLCSISLSNINVSACLVCGKYYPGRGPKSYAYFYALEVGHHVYINMETKRVYDLPEGYEVHNKILEDIKYVVDPRFSEADVRKLDKEPKESTDLAKKRYCPGFIGINNKLTELVQIGRHCTDFPDRVIVAHPVQEVLDATGLRPLEREVGVDSDHLAIPGQGTALTNAAIRRSRGVSRTLHNLSIRSMCRLVVSA
jgi:Zn-finger in ubiquitin-hydrolases and other protein